MWRRCNSSTPAQRRRAPTPDVGAARAAKPGDARRPGGMATDRRREHAHQEGGRASSTPRSVTERSACSGADAGDARPKTPTGTRGPRGPPPARNVTRPGSRGAVRSVLGEVEPAPCGRGVQAYRGRSHRLRRPGSPPAQRSAPAGGGPWPRAAPGAPRHGAHPAAGCGAGRGLSHGASCRVASPHARGLGPSPAPAAVNEASGPVVARRRSARPAALARALSRTPARPAGNPTRIPLAA